MLTADTSLRGVSESERSFGDVPVTALRRVRDVDTRGDAPMRGIADELRVLPQRARGDPRRRSLPRFATLLELLFGHENINRVLDGLRVSQSAALV